MTTLPPGSSIGILGGGQLGRMLASAAAKLGYRCVVLSPEKNPPAAQLANEIICAPYNDPVALDRLAEITDIVTYEFENVPHDALLRLSGKIPVAPGLKALQIGQDRLQEKDFLSGLGIAVAPYRAVDNDADLQSASRDIGLPAILKTRRLGYDGKGQLRLNGNADLIGAFEKLGGRDLILEGFVEFEREVSQLLVRGYDGASLAYPLVHNTHRHHILDISRVPAGVSQAIGTQAQDYAQRLAQALDYIGVIAVEMFVTQDGKLLVNEFAPRVHNSGHWTIEGAVTSQFENHIRAICGLPLGDCTARGQIEMRNLIGEDIDQIPALLKDSHAHVHHYGKGEPRPGRKMGHVTWVRQ